MKKLDEFSDGEEEELKIIAKKRKIERLETKKEAKAKKRKLKEEENKIKESEMWDRLNELNSQFKTIKQAKKEEKEMPATIL